jgi:hypothetical protein
MAIVTPSKIIKYLSTLYIGKRQDFSLLKTEFPPHKNWFKQFNINVDLGFLGIANEYNCKSLSIPHKKSKNKPLTQQQKNENKQLASKRVFIEHSFAGLKRFRILSDKLRLHNFDLYNVILGVCAGLWNFYLSN